MNKWINALKNERNKWTTQRIENIRKKKNYKPLIEQK